MNKLYEIDQTVFNIGEIEKILKESTIFDKIEFSGITVDAIEAKINDLEERQVPERKVLLDMTNEAVTEYWFKNWLHPQLKHAVKPSPLDKRGCSEEALDKDRKRDILHTYENGQHQFNYTLTDIKQWIAHSKWGED
jgi:hypothetical protein